MPAAGGGPNCSASPEESKRSAAGWKSVPPGWSTPPLNPANGSKPSGSLGRSPVTPHPSPVPSGEVVSVERAAPPAMSVEGRHGQSAAEAAGPIRRAVEGGGHPHVRPGGGGGPAGRGRAHVQV